MSAETTPSSQASSMDADDAATARTPAIRIIRGNPDPAQIAALTVVLAAAGGQEQPGVKRPTQWTNRSRYARPRPAVGPGGWRASALPR